MLYRTSTAILVLILAIAAWCLVGYFAWTINADEGGRVVAAQDAQIAATTYARALRTHALILDTASEGAQLKALLDTDVVSVSYMIEEVGKIAGVKVKLGDAMPENVSNADGAAPKAVGFIVAADGKFPALIRAARLFEALPIPSSVTRLDIEHAPASSGGTPALWHMNVYIRVLTTSDISP